MAKRKQRAKGAARLLGGNYNLNSYAYTPDEFKRLLTAPTPRKYRNKKAEADGFTFASEKERNRYLVLKQQQAAGEIRNLRLQVTYDLRVNEVLICKYVADFVYERFANDKDEKNYDALVKFSPLGYWYQIVEDVKGYRTRVYSIKRKLMLACLGIKIKEV